MRPARLEGELQRFCPDTVIVIVMLFGEAEEAVKVLDVVLVEVTGTATVLFVIAVEVFVVVVPLVLVVDDDVDVVVF